MSILKRLWTAANYAIGVLILLGLSGCFYGGRYLGDEPIGEDRVERIRPGQTSVREVLTWLGPPLAIARAGKKTVIVPASGASRSGYREMQSDVFFELFPSRRLRDEEVVYYYDASRRSSLGAIVILIFINIGGSTERVEAERLWLLVDERTGIIEEYVFRVAERNIGKAGSSPVPEDRTQ